MHKHRDSSLYISSIDKNKFFIHFIRN